MATIVTFASTDAQESAQLITDALRDNRGINAQLLDTSLATGYLDSVDAVIVVAKGDSAGLEAGATSFLDANYAELDSKALLLAVLTDDEGATPQLCAVVESFNARTTGYFTPAQVLEKTDLIAWGRSAADSGAA